MVKKVKLRIIFLFLVLASIILSIYLILKSLEENVVYFLSPTDIKNLKEIDVKKIRVGGMVKNQSISVFTFCSVSFVNYSWRTNNYKKYTT